MSDTFITVIAILLAAVLIFVVPLIATSNKMDNIAQTDVQTITSNFVDEIRATGKLTKEKYYKFKEDLMATGNTYDINMEFKILDENPEKKAIQTDKDKIGENVYYAQYTTQIEGILEDDSKSNTFTLKSGDLVAITVKNTNLTAAQQIKNFFYTVVGNDTYTIAGSKSGLVTISGSTETIVAGAEDQNQGNDTSTDEENKNKLLYKLYEIEGNDVNNKGRQLTDTEWTNKNICVEFSSKDQYSMSLQYFWGLHKDQHDNNQQWNQCRYDNCEIMTEKCNIDAYWKNIALEKYSSINENININIDKIKPKIENVLVSDQLANNGQITITNITDEGGSGKKGYYYVWTEKNLTPDPPTSNFVALTSNESYKINADWSNNNKKCTIWAVDNAGNYSEPKSVVVANLVKPVSSQDITLSDISVVEGESLQIPITIEGKYKSIKYSSSQTSIAKVNDSGKLEGVKAGKSTITCTVINYNGTPATKTFVANVLIRPVTENDISISDVNVLKGETVQVSTSINGQYTSISYSSSQEDVAKFVGLGKLEGIKAGISTITCTVTNHNGTTVSKTCTVTVMEVQFYTGSNLMYKLTYTSETERSTKISAGVFIYGAQSARYTWGNSNTQAPINGWKEMPSPGFDDADGIHIFPSANLDTIINEPGNYYLWIELSNKSGKKIYKTCEKVFRVDDELVKILISNDRKPYEKVYYQILYRTNTKSESRKWGFGESALLEAEYNADHKSAENNFPYGHDNNYYLYHGETTEKNGYIYAEASYKKSNGETYTYTANLEITNIDKTLKGNINIGDYVKYKYEPEASTDKVDLLTKVLYKEKYGNTQLISANAINPYLEMMNANRDNASKGMDINGNSDSYNNGIIKLNTLARRYIKDSSIALSARNVGTSTYNNYYENNTMSGYYKGTDNNYEEDYRTIVNHSELLKADNNKAYWLASRKNIVNAGSGPRDPNQQLCYFRKMDETGKLIDVLLYEKKYESKTYTEYAFIRPCITLKDGLLVVDGHGTKNDPYIINEY